MSVHASACVHGEAAAVEALYSRCVVAAQQRSRFAHAAVLAHACALEPQSGFSRGSETHALSETFGDWENPGKSWYLYPVHIPVQLQGACRVRPPG